MRDFATIKPQQLDCYIPDKKIAIEIDGIYWHSLNHGKSKSYHLEKTEKCAELGIRLIHITDFEWNTKKDICKSIILSALGLSNKIYARNCEVKQVTNKERKEFLETNHIEGNVPASYSLGLYHKGELVQLIAVGKSRFKKDEYELMRMCSKLNTTVIGGFSKLLKYQPHDKLISYVDRAKFSGNSYLKNGFTLEDITKPSYKYYSNSKVLNRVSAQKHKLPKILGDKFDNSKTEQQNMMDAGYLCVYDCGTYKLKFKKS